MMVYMILPFGLMGHLLLVWRRPEFRQGFWQRYGILKPMFGQPILIHAASVGELNAIAPLVQQLRLDWPVLVTTTSVTGAARFKQLFTDMPQVEHRFLPFDIGFANRRLLKRIQPRALLLVETELWPGLIAACHQRSIPVWLINGR